jgi:hypothetical protein
MYFVHVMKLDPPTFCGIPQTEHRTGFRKGWRMNPRHTDVKLSFFRKCPLCYNPKAEDERDLGENQI